jgi:hypothetical protein
MILQTHFFNKIYKTSTTLLDETINTGPDTRALWLYSLLSKDTFDLNKIYFKNITYDYALTYIFEVQRLHVHKD